MQTIDVVFRHQDVVPEGLKGKVVVVIDVLRATTVMATALANGAKSVKTIQTPQQALALKTQNNNLLLAGERNAIKLDGFDFGNSPLEMTRESVFGQELILCTSNGTQAVAASVYAKEVIAAAFVNMKAVLDYLILLEDDITIICSGTNGKFSLDDTLAASVLVKGLTRNNEYDLSDSTQGIKLMSVEELSPMKNLKDCFHLKLLLEKGFQKDVEFCLTLDSLNVVPLLKNGYFEV